MCYHGNLIEVDYGQDGTRLGLLGGSKEFIIVNKDGDKQFIKSRMDAYNYMSKLGWEATDLPHVVDGTVIFTKMVTSDEEIAQGFYTLADYKKDNKK